MLPPKKIRVLECIRQGQIGGGETHLVSLLENLDKSIYDPVVLSFTDGPMVTRLREMNIPTHIIHTEKPFDIRVWKRVSALLCKEKIDLVHCHGTRAISNVFKAARSLQIPLIYTVHGWSFHDDQHSVIRKIRIWGEHFLTSRSHKNIAVSESNMMAGKNIMPRFNATVINNGIDRKKFSPARNFKNIRKEIGITNSAILIVFIARFTAHKQPISLIRAFGEALKKQPTLQLLMVGEGDEKKKAIEIVEKNGLKNNVQFLPFREDVPDLLAAADIFVLPSLWEGLPIGLLEAMSMGKTVIATNVDGTKEIVKDHQNGLLIETSNMIENLTNAILLLSANTELRTQFGKNAMQTVQENFDAVTMTRKTEAVYAELLDKTAYLN